MSRFDQLDQMARAAQGSDPAALRSLLGEFLAMAELRNQQAAPFQERIVKAEFAYRAGQHPGVREGDVVKVVNQLATTLSLPSYAQTSPKQFRYLRIFLLTTIPHIRARRVEIQHNAISDQMSPAEAAIVTLMLVTQKLNGPAYQVDPSTWDAKHPAVPAAPPSPPSFTGGSRLRVGEQPDKALRSALSNVAAEMAMSDLLQLANSFVTALGY